jgi:multidrug efflux pump subunit AcrB
MLTTDIQAAAMRPLAVSVGFGMLFSIPVILILLPCIVVSLERGGNTASGDVEFKSDGGVIV